MPATRRIEIVAEVAQHLADAHRDTLDRREADWLVRELASVERFVAPDPPVFGKARHTVMTTIWQDIKLHALRSLRLNPGYTAIVLGTLALGIGANAAIFSVADAVMLRPYPYPDMDRIVILNETTRAAQPQQMSVAWPTFQDWQAQNQTFEHLGIYRNAVVNLTGGTQPERLNGAVASSALFAVMGVQPVAGRVFGDADDRPDAARVALISERLWRGRFNGDPGLVGSALVLNNEPHIVVGVMAPGMRFPSRLTDVWLPIGPAIATFPKSRGNHPGLYAVGKLKAGVPFESAVADMDTIARRIEAANPDTNKDVAVAMIPYYEQIVRNIRPTLFVLLGAVGFVLLIACANLANLMLARAERRQREIAVRSALGAERWRIVQQLLTESLLLAVAGGTLGILLATWIVKLFVASQPVTIPRIDMIAVDGRVIAVRRNLVDRDRSGLRAGARRACIGSRHSVGAEGGGARRRPLAVTALPIGTGNRGGGVGARAARRCGSDASELHPVDGDRSWLQSRRRGDDASDAARNEVPGRGALDRISRGTAGPSRRNSWARTPSASTVRFRSKAAAPRRGWRSRAGPCRHRVRPGRPRCSRRAARATCARWASRFCAAATSPIRTGAARRQS